jgi:hypothetical protein
VWLSFELPDWAAEVLPLGGEEGQANQLHIYACFDGEPRDYSCGGGGHHRHDSSRTPQLCGANGVWDVHSGFGAELDGSGVAGGCKLLVLEQLDFRVPETESELLLASHTDGE